MRRPTIVDLMLLVTVLLWAFNFTVTKYVLTHGWKPLAYSSIRYSAGALLFSAFTYKLERSFRIGRRRDLLLLVIAAGAGIWLNQLSYVYAIKFTTATTVALVLGITPIFAALGAFAAGVERLSFRFWIAAVVSFGGVALIAAGSAGGRLSADVKGVALSVATAATWAAYSVVIAPLMRRYSPYRISAIVLVAGVVPLLATAAGQLREQSFSLGFLAWAGLVYGLIGPLFLTNILWFRAVDRVGPSRATLFANIQPFFAAIFALLILSERLTVLQVAGGFAIAAGILLGRAPGAEPERGGGERAAAPAPAE
jgi:drug/metabolite transporter (DMT)-like permease